MIREAETSGTRRLIFEPKTLATSRAEAPFEYPGWPSSAGGGGDLQSVNSDDCSNRVGSGNLGMQTCGGVRGGVAGYF